MSKPRAKDPTPGEPDKSPSAGQQEKANSDNITPHKRDRERFNIFIKNHLFPDAASLFDYRPQAPVDIKNDCLVTLDTSTLLLPYTVSKHSLNKIGEVYKSLVDQGRLFICGQVAREFVTNRATKQLDLLDHWHKINSEIPGIIQKSDYPLLESFDEYKIFKEIQGDLKEIRTRYSKAIGDIIRRIKSWCADDPISELYRSLFVGAVVVDIEWDEAEIEREIEHRNLHKIPPGYTDQTKSDKGIGDYLIWKTVLERAKDKRSVIFVSQDEKKGDWVYNRGDNRLYARYELLDEFRRASDGRSFHNLSLADFMELFGASGEVVDEVRRSEDKESSKLLTRQSNTTNKRPNFSKEDLFSEISHLSYLLNSIRFEISTYRRIPISLVELYKFNALNMINRLSLVLPLIGSGIDSIFLRDTISIYSESLKDIELLAIDPSPSRELMETVMKSLYSADSYGNTHFKALIIRNENF